MRISELPKSSKAARGALALGLAAAAILVVAIGTFSGGPGPAETSPADVAASSGPLDGLAVVGSFGPADGAGDRPDTLYFGDGHAALAAAPAARVAVDARANRTVACDPRR